MSSGLLFQVFISLLIVLVFVLIIVCLKLVAILDDVNQTTAIAKKRAIQADSYLDDAGKKINGWSDTIQGFFSSLSAINLLKDKVEEYFNKKQKKEKGE